MRPHTKGRRHSSARLKIIVRFEHNVRGHDAVGKDFLLIIDIVDEAVERTHALQQTATELCPLAAGNYTRNEVERPSAVNVAALGVDRKRNTHLFDRQLGGDATRR